VEVEAEAEVEAEMEDPEVHHIETNRPTMMTRNHLLMANLMVKVLETMHIYAVRTTPNEDLLNAQVSLPLE
jgi:hypothetical protein